MSERLQTLLDLPIGGVVPWQETTCRAMITRVPGGWVYKWESQGGGGEYDDQGYALSMAAVFVPEPIPDS